MSVKIFNKYYRKLNPAQKEVVDHIDGPIMVVAGPGTGKTSILSLRIANILKLTDTAPESILALTFSESAANNMRRQLGELIGSVAYSVVINTFHGYCNNIITDYPDEFPEIIGATNISESDQAKLIKTLLANSQLKLLRPLGDPFYYLKPALHCINELKREGISPEKFARILKQEQIFLKNDPELFHQRGADEGKPKNNFYLRQKQLQKNQELLKLYTDYQEALRKQHLYDYNDMIFEVVKKLEQNKSLLLILQESSQYLLVDEHQDSNFNQNRLLELLANFHKNPNIFVVGDEKQAIFRFQGASLENFNYFRKLYPAARIIALENNYRSSQLILDAAHQILPSIKRLKAKNSTNRDGVTVYGFSKPDVENYFIAHDIKSHQKRGLQADEIAILYRDNRDAFPIAKALEKTGVPFVIESEQNLLEDFEIKKLVLLLDSINDFGRDEKLLRVLHIDFLGLDPLDVYKVTEQAKQLRKSLFSLIASVAALKKLELTQATAITDLYQNLRKWHRFSQNHSLTELFELVVVESGLLKHLLGSPLASENLLKLNSFFDEIQEFTANHKNSGLNEFFEHLDLMEEHGVFSKKIANNLNRGRVHLMTAHKAKGREFERVYIVNANDGHWGNRRRIQPLVLPSGVYAVSGWNLPAHDLNEDERRLFYVALTRAKHSVVISHSQTTMDGRELLPSQFLAELAPQLLTSGDSSAYERGFTKDQTWRLVSAKKTPPRLKDRDFVAALFEQRGLSVTALNNYLDCPWKYFYQNLLRIPKSLERSQMYGIAVHAALRDLFDNRVSKTFSKSYLLDRFGHHLKQQPLSDLNLTDWQQRGHKALAGYYQTYHKTWNKNVLCELAINGILLTPEIRLTGQIDKLELLGGPQVNVVDYKTGKPKSRNMILGQTRTAGQIKAANIKRQLVFYNLLLNHYHNGKYQMVQGEIDFVEPDEQGRYHKESFQISKTEIAELEELIKHAVAEILGLKFWNRRCDNLSCKFCDLRRLMENSNL